MNYSSRGTMSTSSRGMSSSARGTWNSSASNLNASGLINNNENVVYKYKLVFLGDEGCGKTSIITRLMEDKFSREYNATVGVDFISKTMTVDDRVVRLQVWDTAGQARFRSSIPSYIKDAQMIVLVYDVSNRKTWDNISHWLKDIKTVRKNDFGSENLMICLIGNKTDVRTHQTQVTSLEGDERASKNNWMFLECSAKAGYNIRRIFQKIAEKLPVDLGDTSIRDISSRSAMGSSRRRNYY